MWNKTQFLKLWMHVREKEGKRILIPLLIHLQSLRSYLDDLADVSGLFPENTVLHTESSNQKSISMGLCAVSARSFAELLGDLHGFQVKIKVKEKKGDSVHVDIRAI